MTIRLVLAVVTLAFGFGFAQDQKPAPPPPRPPVIAKAALAPKVEHTDAKPLAAQLSREEVLELAALQAQVAAAQTQIENGNLRQQLSQNAQQTAFEKICGRVGFPLAECQLEGSKGMAMRVPPQGSPITASGALPAKPSEPPSKE